MTYHALPRAFATASQVSVGAKAGSALMAWLKGVLRSLWRRREISELARLDDRMLRDIGISRADVDAALGGPWHGDPTVLLARRSAERRQRAHATARRSSLDIEIENRLRRCA